MLLLGGTLQSKRILMMETDINETPHSLPSFFHALSDEIKILRHLSPKFAKNSLSQKVNILIFIIFYSKVLFCNAKFNNVFINYLFSLNRHSRVTLVTSFRIILSAKLFMENCIYTTIFLRPMFEEAYFNHVALMCQI